MRTQLLEGREHFVLPVVMIVEGVLPGSRGPLLYQSEDIRDSVAAWNGRPVVVYHPAMEHEGRADNPIVFDKQRVGTIFNAQFYRNKLTAEAWIDVARVELVDRRVLNAIRANKPIEVSTGVTVDTYDTKGVYNGREYSAVATNFRPDHLAILPDRPGACSIKDGCGLLRVA